MHPKRIYCTYFDHRYLAKGLVLIESLRRTSQDVEVLVLCLDDQSMRVLGQLAIDGVSTIELKDIEAFEPRLSDAKKDRSSIEFYFTCGPSLLRYAFETRRDVDQVAYLDSDLWFKSDAQQVWDEVGDAPVAIIPHNYPDRNDWLKKFGTFNVGFVGFRRGEEGERCLRWWSERCIEWCYDRVEGDRFADQRYLDRFSVISPNLRVIKNKGANLAPWNVDRYAITEDGGDIRIDGEPVVFFHFHGVKTWLGVFYTNSHRLYRSSFSRLVRKYLYVPYVSELLKANATLGAYMADDRKSSLPRGNFDRAMLKHMASKARALSFNLLDLVGGRMILVWGQRAR